jgi:hypothetical protein
MKQDGVEKWIRTHASIDHRGRFGRNRWKSPEIWMVTGVQLVTGGEIHFEGSASKTISGKAGGDLGAVTGLAPPGALKLNGEASHGRSNGAKNDFGHEDERAWAAQFMPLMIEFGREEDAELTSQKNKHLPKTIRQFGLEDVPDLRARGIRAGQERSHSPTGPVPELIGRITVQPNEGKSTDSTEEDSEGIIVDDTPYVSSAQNADWEKYEEYKQFLSKAEKNNNMRRVVAST